MKYDFVAVDFENADNDQFACAVGIVAVIDHKIVEEIYHLIQPPGNKYGIYQSNVHKITSNDTKYSPTLEFIWPEIKKYFENQNIVMHNAPTDRAILHKSLTYYLIPIPNYSYNDTCVEINCGKIGLPSLAKAMNVEFYNHHNALEDARATAKIWLKHLQGFEPDDLIIKTERNKPREGLFSNKKIDKEFYKKDLSNADESSPFYDRKVVITGDFSDKRKMAKKLRFMGADICYNISRNTHFVIIGNNPGPKKMETLEKLKFDGYHITALYEENLTRIFEGNLNDEDFVDKETRKDLKITIDHITGPENLFNIESNRINLFYGKEIYVSQSIKSRMRLNHLMGYLGAFSNSVLEKDINIILLSDTSIKNLENGIHDEDLAFIENTYNSNKSINFNFQFLIESDFISYFKHRIKNGNKNDEVVIEVYTKYIESL